MLILGKPVPCIHVVSHQAVFTLLHFVFVVSLTGEYAPNSFEVRFVFPLILRMGKLAAAERETDPKFVTPDLVSLLSVERWTETFSGCK